MMKQRVKSVLRFGLLLSVGLAFLGATPSFSGASGGAAKLLKSADRCRKALERDSRKKRYRHHWFRCLNRYKSLYSRYPHSDEAAWAMYHSGRLFSALHLISKRSSDLDKAILLYGRLVKEHRAHRLADDAQYYMAMLYLERKGDAPRAREAMQRVVEDYPSGDMAPRAEKILGRMGVQIKKSPSSPRGFSDAARLLNEADSCRRVLEQSPRKKRYRHHWFRCLNRYKSLYSRYPHTNEAAWAMYHSAGLYSALHSYSRLSKDLEEAIRLYRRLAEDYRDHRLADDAQYLIGEIYYERKQDPAQAYVEFLKVDIKFPKGDMRPKAKKMLDQLSVKLSKAGDGMGKKKGPIPRARRFAVKDIRHWSTPNYTRVVIDVEGPITYQHNLLQADPDHKKPRRIYFDLNGAYVSDQIDRPKLIDDGLLRRARAAQYQHDIVRVVLDMESVGRYEAFHLHDPFRIVVDVRRLEGKGVESGHQVAEKEDPAGKKARRDETKKGKDSLAKQLGLNVRRIVLDPGHGGKDPGCASSKRVREKTIVLKIAKYLAKKIRKEIGCEVLLTRAGDTYLGLEQRTAIANMKKADLFVSLHINAHKDRHVHGIETYFLNLATDERAVLVAARENATSEKNISDLQTILNDLMLNTKIHESSRLAQEVQKGMVYRLKKSYGNVRDLGVKQAPFYVLIGAQMPAILVETGFITNSMERKRLLSGKYQERVAEGICAGIKRYIKSIDKVYTGG